MAASPVAAAAAAAGAAGAMSMKTTRIALADWCHRAGLGRGGTKRELARRLYAHLAGYGGAVSVATASAGLALAHDHLAVALVAPATRTPSAAQMSPAAAEAPYAFLAPLRQYGPFTMTHMAMQPTGLRLTGGAAWAPETAARPLRAALRALPLGGTVVAVPRQPVPVGAAAGYRLRRVAAEAMLFAMLHEWQLAAAAAAAATSRPAHAETTAWPAPVAVRSMTAPSLRHFFDLNGRDAVRSLDEPGDDPDAHGIAAVSADAAPLTSPSMRRSLRKRQAVGTVNLLIDNGLLVADADAARLEQWEWCMGPPDAMADAILAALAQWCWLAAHSAIRAEIGPLDRLAAIAAGPPNGARARRGL
ncbi:hypothetical protein CXG81DRAFT_26601 [Caulochytrium protostelioides]|uniref:SAP domain-containing protein n=1 Tax=Caulochytrium protostelioides TaxID=1555241 RepID=A0A4P9X689_9FUNG|nr:hypothetical protein CXG81DRAFT_26601 [Caulochytrium protostelioides]|eukprot:RKP00696.1 hypothetical protein CXG81DRAFT_26601 [Caulochytrium protostelioides]